jgi:hypothetical protein
VLEEYLVKAGKLDGPAFAARREYMVSMQRRWHGSIQAMQGHYEASIGSGLTAAQLGKLHAMLLYEQVQATDANRGPKARLNLAVEANRLSETTDGLREIIWLKVRAGRYADALREMNRALKLDRVHAWTRVRRATRCSSSSDTRRLTRTSSSVPRKAMRARKTRSAGI